MLNTISKCLNTISAHPNPIQLIYIIIQLYNIMQLALCQSSWKSIGSILIFVGAIGHNCGIQKVNKNKTQ